MNRTTNLERIESAWRALSLARSVILSGERMTPDAQREIDDGIDCLRAVASDQRRVETAPECGLRRFIVYRYVDESMTTGTGTIAHGILFADGTTVVKPLVGPSPVLIYPNLSGARAGTETPDSRIVWVDQRPPEK